MPKLDRASASRLATCHPLLRRLFERVGLSYKCIVLEGHVGRQAQERAVAEGRATQPYPHGPHNGYPSRAIDAAPARVDLTNVGPLELAKIHHFAGYVKGVAELMAIRIRWAGEKWEPGCPAEDLTHFELGYDVN